MRILLINKFLHPNGGAEAYLFALGENLQRQGHQVQYFGMEHPERIVGNRVNAYASTMDFHSRFSWKKLTYPFKTIYSPEARRKLRQVLADFQPEICHLNNFNYQLTPSIVLEIQNWKRKTGADCKIFYTAHDYQLVCPNHMCYNPNTQTNCEACFGGQYRQCLKGKCIHGSSLRSALGGMEAFFWKRYGVYKHLDGIFCCSKFVKSKLDTDPVLAGKTQVLENFVSVERKLSCTSGKYVLYFGRFSQEKGILTLVEACKQLPEIPFVFAGAGPMEGTLEGVSNIVNKGFCRGSALDALLEGAKFVICPSMWNEPFGLTVAEAMAKGIPVIATDTGGISEQIQPGVTGELVPAGDVDALAEKIRRWWEEPARVEKMAANCRKRPVRTVDMYCRELLRQYRERG